MGNCKGMQGIMKGIMQGISEAVLYKYKSEGQEGSNYVKRDICK